MIDYKDVTHPRNLRHHSGPVAPEGDSRSPAQKDRDRIVYTSAFRRLAEVTQVASRGHAQVFHNRLTHSLQVAQVGRTVAKTLGERQQNLTEEVGGIDPDTVEAACLAHDLGHPPFGHTAEEELNELAADAVGGFEGNAQSFRVVTKLTFKSESYPGLDLTRATLAAILKYPWFKGQNDKKPRKWGAYKSETEDFEFARKLDDTPKSPTGQPTSLILRGLQKVLKPVLNSADSFQRSPEADLMDWADDVTYSVHDLEDFYRAGRIPMHILVRSQENAERDRFFDDIYRRHSGETDFFARADLEQTFNDLMSSDFWLIYEPYSGTEDQRKKLRRFTARMIHEYVNGVSIDEKTRSISISDEMKREVAVLKELTWTYVIEAPAFAMQREGQRAVIRRLYEVYSEAADAPKKRNSFPPFYREQLERCSSHSERMRAVVDLIASMTEPQAIATYRQLTGAWPLASFEEIVR
jgi:dGTPase